MSSVWKLMMGILPSINGGSWDIGESPKTSGDKCELQNRFLHSMQHQKTHYCRAAPMANSRCQAQRGTN